MVDIREDPLIESGCLLQPCIPLVLLRYIRANIGRDLANLLLKQCLVSVSVRFSQDTIETFPPTYIVSVLSPHFSCAQSH